MNMEPSPSAASDVFSSTPVYDNNSAIMAQSAVASFTTTPLEGTALDLFINDVTFDSNNFTSSDNVTGKPLPIDMRFNDGHRLAIIVYSLLMIVSAIGNITVFSAIVRLRMKGRLSRINLFLLHLAIADLLVTFLMMPLEIGWNATVSWQAGDTMCRVMSFFRIFGLYLSGNILVCISLDRYFAVLKPLGIPDANSRGRLMLTFAWLGSFVCSLPQAYIFHVESHPEFRWYEQCVTFNSFPGPKVEMVYNFFGFFFLYIFPLLMIIFCYARILFEIYRVNRQKRNEDELRRSNMNALGRAKIRTLKMTVIIVATFFFCWTPYNVMSLWYWFDKESAKAVDQRIQKGLFLFACTNSCVNPLIYGLFHFRARRKPSSSGAGVPRSQPQAHRPPAVPSENYKMRVRWNPNRCCVMECGSSGSSGDTRTPAMSSSPGRLQNQNHVHVRPTQQIWVRNSTRNFCVSEHQLTGRDVTVSNGHVRRVSNPRQNRSRSNSHSGHRRCSTFQMHEFGRQGVRVDSRMGQCSSRQQHYIDEGGDRRRSCLSSIL